MQQSRQHQYYQVQAHFETWNALPHEEAIAIAEAHGITVEEGGFQAYLTNMVGQGDTGGIIPCPPA